jgi:hypothetical protein
MEAVDTAICEGITGNIYVRTLDTNSIDISGNGQLGTPIFADVRLDPKPTNILSISSDGVLAEERNVVNVRDNIVQHAIFERPPIRSLTYTDNDSIVHSRTKLVLTQGSYATDYSSNNPDVELFWGDTPAYENSLDNEIGAGHSLSHDYLTLQPESGEIELRTYNSTYLTNLYTFGSFNTPISGFKFLKGGSLLTEISVYGANAGTSGVFDFKNMYNVSSLNITSTYSETYSGKGSRYTLANIQDLHSLTSANFIAGDYQNNTEFELLNSNFNQLQLASCRGFKSITANNQTNLSFSADASSVETLDFRSANLSNISINNCGDGYLAYINNILFKLKSFGLTGQFDFSILKHFNFLRSNGLVYPRNVYTGSYNQIIPTKILMYNINNSNNLEFVNSNQDWVKDELFISLNNNGLINGSATTYVLWALGANYLNTYYNPTWAPLNGSVAGLSVVMSSGVITAITNSSRSGSGYNSIPSIIISGAGSGLASTQVMSLDSQPQNINAGGVGYAVNGIYTLTGAGSIVSPTIRVTTVSGGAVTGYEFVNPGEFTSLPATLTEAGGLVISTANKWNYKYSIITNGGGGYDNTTIFKLEVSTSNGTGTGTASVASKAAIEALHTKGWDLAW